MSKNMRQPLKMAAFAAAFLIAGATFGDATPGTAVDAVVSGTAHDALFGLAFDGQNGVAVGAAGVIQQSSDGGKTWKQSEAPTELSLLGVSIRGNHRIAVGQVGVAIISDTGDKWEKIDTGSKERLMNVSVNANGLAVAVGSFGTIMKSDDAGKTWKSIAPASWDAYVGQNNLGAQPHLYDVKVDDSGVITIGGEFGNILRSTDGGATWKQLHSGEASVFALELRADGNGYAVGQSGLILKTTDNGNTWQTVESGSQAILLGVNSNAAGKVFITGMHDMVSSTDGGKTFQHVNNPDVASSWYEAAAAPDGQSDAYAVGHAGRIVRLSSGS